MVLLKTLLLPALSLIGGAAAASNVQEFTPSNFDSSVFSGTPSLVEFFAPWCGHCKNLAPVYEELANSFANNKNVNIAKVDGDAHKDLSQRFSVGGFPTLKWFDGKNKEPIDYTGGRDLESLQAFVQEKSGLKAKRVAKPPSHVVHLTDGDFKSVVGKDQDVFVAFTAPWCGHCKSLAPTWEDLANDYASDSSTIKIAKVDAEVHKGLATEYGVQSYPTIKYFPKGSTQAIDYSAGRDIASFVKFVNEKAGLHRLPGGGLDVTAGTIEALDTVVAKLTGSNLAQIQKDAQKAAKGLSDKYAEYYVKVLNKLADNKEYVEKESTRLGNILSKGGLAQEKQDDLTSRLNILKKFIKGEKDEL